MINMKKLITTTILILTTITLFGCSNISSASQSNESRYQEPPASDITYIGMFDSIDTAIIESINHDSKTITFINYTLNRSYTLEYTDSTNITDKFGQAMSAAQITIGEIVDVYFMKNNKKLIAMNQSKTAFAFENIIRHTLDSERSNATIGNENYRLLNNAVIISDGKQIEAADIISGDIITVRGFDREIWSIVVQKGHGYLKLQNDAYAIGGWIEIGQNIIQRVTDNMLLSVPEGTIEVNIFARGFNYSGRVTIERNKETILDLGGVEKEELKKGRIIFSITPATATVYIDGEETNVNGIVELEFGLYQIMCEAPGYDTITQHIKVSENIASVIIVMDETRADLSHSSSVSDNNLSGSLTAGINRVYIDAPLNVEVYKNGVYMGISPLYFNKTTGSHTITLRREGYITKSYQIKLDDEPLDVTYSFSNLERNSIEAGNSVSGNN